MEGQLSRIFQTANDWNALILLDEADVYLEQRSMKDVSRNKLVSVFLRKLEYCEGILFMTINRVRDFDEAIISRIHLVLRYHELDIGRRSQIRQDMLHRGPHVSRRPGNCSQGDGTLGHHGIQRSTSKFVIRYLWRLLPLINHLLDQKRGYYRSRSCYQEKYSSGLFPSPAGGHGEREFHPRIQRHQRYGVLISLTS